MDDFSAHLTPLMVCILGWGNGTVFGSGNVDRERLLHWRKPRYAKIPVEKLNSEIREDTKMANLVTLRKFTSSELLFDDEETRQILKFFFNNQQQTVNQLTINDKVREFAQGLLVEAVDASYAMGFIEALFKASANPSAGTKQVLTKFANKAAKHWFKHASADNLLKVEIYEIVRSRIALNFGRYLAMLASGIAKKETSFTAMVAYA